MIIVGVISKIFSDLNNYQTTTFHMTTGVRPTRPNTELHSVIWTTQQSTKEDKTNGKTIYVLVNVEC